jgi:hypothetical protein
MNCPECANPVEKDAQFCPKCFARIEPPGFWKRFLCLFQSTGRPRRSIINIKKSVTIKTTDKDGQHHEYHSLEDVPPELRAEIEKLSSEALKEGFSSSVSDGPITKIVSKKTVSLYKIGDASGNGRVYHSLDELPPEIRAAMETAENEKQRPGGDSGVSH